MYPTSHAVSTAFWAIVFANWTTWEIEGWREWAARQEQEDGA